MTKSTCIREGHRCFLKYIITMLLPPVAKSVKYRFKSFLAGRKTIFNPWRYFTVIFSDN